MSRDDLPAAFVNALLGAAYGFLSWHFISGINLFGGHVKAPTMASTLHKICFTTEGFAWLITSMAAAVLIGSLLINFFKHRVSSGTTAGIGKSLVVGVGFFLLGTLVLAIVCGFIIGVRNYVTQSHQYLAQIHDQWQTVQKPEWKLSISDGIFGFSLFWMLIALPLGVPFGGLFGVANRLFVKKMRRTVGAG